MTVSVDTTKTGDQGSLFSTLAIQAGGVLAMAVGSSFNLYNTADQITNYERLRADFSSNIARISTQIGGSGTARSLRIGVATDTSNAPSVYTQYGASAPFISHVIGNTSAATGHQWTVSFSASSGTQTAFNFAPTINQSGTASYTAFDINPTETATGSGTKLLQRWAVGGSEVARVNTAGSFYSGNVVAVSTLGLSSSVGGTIDVRLARDAADALALRNSTTAQAFRVYNTYTDASNYERGGVGWGSSIFYVGPTAAGTGTLRSMSLIGNTVGIQTGPSLNNRWSFNAAGHFVADTDNSYDIGASGANRPRNLYMASWIRMATTTVASLPAAGTAAAGAMMFVTDATATTFASVVAGGGANVVPVYSDGTNWRIG